MATKKVDEIEGKVEEAFAESARYFPTQLQQFQFFDKYSRFNYELGRRETWIEAVNRAVAFLHELAGPRLEVGVYERIRHAILEMKVMPSMRLLAMAGPAARRSHITIYNCAYLPVESINSFVEALIISMSGCGVGFSVERDYIDKLPSVKPQQQNRHNGVFVVPDDTEGWAAALQIGLETWFDGGDIKFDLSEVRPAGAPLRTKGGQASGPEPLRELLNFARRRILARQGQHLRSIDAHDIMCAVGNAAISGGVRRSAMLSLFDYDDTEMRRAKSGDFERENSQRWNANNSAVWPETGIPQPHFLELFTEMVTTGRGEPGVFNSKAVLENRPIRRKADSFGCNPCAEINLRPYQFCNLSAVIARQGDDYTSLMDKVEVATIIGTIQATATNFPGLRSIWKENCEEERLLGVDITGQMDSWVVQDWYVLKEMRELALLTNEVYASKLGINRAAAVTCVKPSGNTSLLVDCAPGIHTRWSPYYIRNVRISTHSPLFQVLKEAGVPMQPENGQTTENAVTWVVSFPVKSPVGTITRKDRSALEQCGYWYIVKRFWAEHSVSATITYKPEEVMKLLNWVWDNRNEISGMTFLPATDANYEQLPYIEISEEEYNERVTTFPNIDWSRLSFFDQQQDKTTAAQELACAAGTCEI